MRHTRIAVLSVLALGAIAVSGCGSDDSSSTTPSTAAATPADTTAATTASTTTAPAATGDVPTAGDTTGRRAAAGYVYAGTEEQVAEAKAKGAADAGKTTKAPTGKTIGIIQLSGQSATSKSIVQASRDIAKLFGYKVVVCDPNFDAQKVPQCATSIASQKPDVVFSVSQNPGPMGSGVKQVADAGGLWFGTGSESEPSPYIDDYGIDGIALSQVLDSFMFKTIDEKNPGSNKKIFSITAPTVGLASKNSGEQLKKDVAAQSGYSLIDHNLDLANAVQDTLNTTRQTLEQNPDLAAVWTLCDFCVPLMAQTVSAKQPDRKTVVVGQFSSPESIADVRKGTVDGIADYAWSLPVWVGMDQALEKWANGKDPVKGDDVFASYSLPFMKPYVITKENALASGPAPVYGPDYESYFKAKWAKEFGIGA
jgi:ABC-type sugar transport system substrate-binding protein